jgi:hypothetical protein
MPSGMSKSTFNFVICGRQARRIIMAQTTVITVIAHDKARYAMGSETINVHGDSPETRKDAAIEYAMKKWPDATTWNATKEETHTRVAGTTIKQVKEDK